MFEMLYFFSIPKFRIFDVFNTAMRLLGSVRSHLEFNCTVGGLSGHAQYNVRG